MRFRNKAAHNWPRSSEPREAHPHETLVEDSVCLFYFLIFWFRKIVFEGFRTFMDAVIVTQWLARSARHQVPVREALLVCGCDAHGDQESEVPGIPRITGMHGGE